MRLTSRRLLSAGIVTAMLLALTTNANASRRSSLHGDILLEDVTDSFFMPQLLLKYRNLIRIQMGASADVGDGLLIFGTDEMAFGIVAHRGDNVSPSGAVMLSAQGLPGALLNGANSFPLLTQFPTPANIVDLLMALKLGDDAGLGFRLGIANGGTSTTPDTGDGTSTSQTSLNIGAGFSSLGEGLRMDLSLNLNIGLGSTDSGGGNEVSGNDINIGLNGRFYLPMEDQVELGIIGGLNLGFGGVTTTAGGNDASSSAFDLSLVAGAGPVYKLARARIAAYGFLGFSTASSDPDADDDVDASSATTITIPGVHMAMEVDVTDWFRFRGGLEYAWRIASETDPGGNSAGENSGSFGWSGGFGLVFDKFTMDFALQNSFFTNGPNFIGGGNGFAASATAAYSF